MEIYVNCVLQQKQSFGFVFSQTTANGQRLATTNRKFKILLSKALKHRYLTQLQFKKKSFCLHFWRSLMFYFALSCVFITLFLIRTINTLQKHFKSFCLRVRDVLNELVCNLNGPLVVNLAVSFLMTSQHGDCTLNGDE